MDRLTPEQEALIPVYRDKWLKIARSTAPLDYQKARKAVKATYKIIGRKEPIIIFVKSPAAAWKYIVKHSMPLLEYEKIIDKLRLEMRSTPLMKISSKTGTIFKKIAYLLSCGWDSGIVSGAIKDMFNDETWKEYLDKYIKNHPRLNVNFKVDADIFFHQWEWSPDLGTSEFVWRSSCMDYCISVLDCNHDIKIWNTDQQLMKNTGWIFPFEKTCLVCDRPTDLCLDKEERLHAEGKPAIQFRDGFSIYSHHGLILPEKYGNIHPQQWEVKWIFSEKNTRLRGWLIERIGYSRICQEFPATEVETWEEYTLLRIKHNAASEPICLLKFTWDTSIKPIYAVRVPPDVASARDAIGCVNWSAGVGPEDSAQVMGAVDG